MSALPSDRDRRYDHDQDRPMTPLRRAAIAASLDPDIGDMMAAVPQSEVDPLTERLRQTRERLEQERQERSQRCAEEDAQFARATSLRRQSLRQSLRK